jgi:hypothetical protein
MKKSIIIGLIILSVFLLCSLSYHPIMAKEKVNIESNKPEIKSKKDFNLEKYSELYKQLYDKFLTFEDCDCYNKNGRSYPIVCLLLTPLWILVAIITEIMTPAMNPTFIYFAIARLGTDLGCWWG